MTGPRFAIFICVLLIQRATAQTACQSDLYVSINDILRAIGQHGGNQQGVAIGQECGCSQPLPVINQAPCGCQTGTLGNQLALGQNSLGCGQIPSLSIGQPTISLLGQQGCQQGGLAANLPGISLNQNSLGCGGILPSLSIGQPRLSGQSINLPGVSIPENLGCGCQIPRIGNQLGLGNLQALPSLNSLTQACGQESIGLTRPCLSGLSPQIGIQGNSILGSGCGVGGVPTAVLQAPPYGIVFTGENLIIEGAVEVYGSMPFNSAVEVAGAIPTAGCGRVQYVCNDRC